MNVVIKAPWSKLFTILDDKIIYGKKEIPFSSITKVTLSPMKKSSETSRVVTIDYNGGFILPVYDPQNPEHTEGIEYLLSCVDKDSADELKKEKTDGFKKEM